MKLSTFILDNIEAILQEWENFAKTIFPAKQQTSTGELRDHAKQMLLVIIDELSNNEFKSKSKLKSKSKSKSTKTNQNLDLKNNLPDTPAEEHGVSRLLQGFTVTEIASEYQALRKSVMKLYSRANQKALLRDLIRFNELIDTALYDTIFSYSNVKEKQTLLFDTMLSSSADLSYILDLSGSFLYVNKAMTDLFQVPAYEILGKANYNAAMPSGAEIREYTKTILETRKKCSGEIIVEGGATESEESFEFVLAPVCDSDNEIVAIAGTSRNITKQKNAEAQVWHNANFDYLTGLANRRRFNDKLEESIKHTKRTEQNFAIIFVDLDGFKKINDKFGHDWGDYLLQQIAHRLTAGVREIDVVARSGGDEFILLITEDKDARKAKVIAEKLLATIKEPILIKKTNVSLTASIGIALCPKNGMNPDTLIKKADKAMYVSKKRGGDKYNFG